MAEEQNSVGGAEEIQQQEEVKATKPKKKIAFKGLNVIVLVLIIGLLGASGYLFAEKANLEKLNALLKQQLDRAVAEKRTLRIELRETASIKEELEGKVEEMQTEAETLAAQIEEEKRAKEAALLQLEGVEETIDTLKEQVELEQKEKLSLASVLKKEKSENNQLSEQLDQLKLAKASLEEKLKNVLKKRGVNLKKIVVKPDEEGFVRPEGKILVVNREFDFVVINLGEKDGLEMGTILTVSRDGQTLAKVEVEKIYANMSAAIILPGTDKELLKEGDLVKPL